MTYIGTQTHTFSPPPFLPWPNLSNRSHPRAFSSVCPRWPLLHLTAPRGAFPMAQSDLRLSSWGCHPRGDNGGRGAVEEEEGGCNSSLRQQQGVKSFRLWHEEARAWATCTHKHTCITATTTTTTHTHSHLHRSENANMHRALELIQKHVFCIKIKVTQSEHNGDLFIKSSPNN